MNNIGDIRQMTEEIGGIFMQNKGRLSLSFSREVTGDAGLRLFITDLFTTGALGDIPPVLSPEFLEEVSDDMPLQLSDNADMHLGSLPHEIIIEIDFMKTI